VDENLVKVSNGLRGIGLLEVNFGSQGATASIGTGGIDVGGALYDLAKRGIDYAGMSMISNDKIREAAIKAYGYGDWTAENASMRIASGLDELLFDKSLDGFGYTASNGNGGRTITIQDSGNAFTNAVFLQHEAYRDGIVAAGNSQETLTAARAHTEMAMRMQAEGYDMVSNPNLMLDMLAYGMGPDFFNAYVGDMYDSSADYWKLTKDGTLLDDLRNSLYRETKDGGEFLIWDLEKLDKETSFYKLFDVDEYGYATFSNEALKRIGLYEILNSASNINENNFNNIANNLIKMGNLGYYIDFTNLKNDMKYSKDLQIISKAGSILMPSDEFIFNPSGYLWAAGVFGTLSWTAGFNFNVSESPFYNGIQQEETMVLRDTTVPINHFEKMLRTVSVVIHSPAPLEKGMRRGDRNIGNALDFTVDKYNATEAVSGAINLLSQFTNGTLQGISVGSVGVPQWEFNGIKYFSLWEPQLTGMGRGTFDYTPKFLSTVEAIISKYPQKINNYMSMPSGISKTLTAFWNNLKGWN